MRSKLTAEKWRQGHKSSQTHYIPPRLNSSSIFQRRPGEKPTPNISKNPAMPIEKAPTIKEMKQKPGPPDTTTEKHSAMPRTPTSKRFWKVEGSSSSRRVPVIYLPHPLIAPPPPVSTTSVDTSSKDPKSCTNKNRSKAVIN